MRSVSSSIALGLVVTAVAVAAANGDSDSEQPTTTSTSSGGGIGGAGGAGGAGGTGGDPLEPFEIDPQRVYDDVAYLASPELEGRLPGEAGNEEALDYVETLFTELGLTPAGEDDTFRQPFFFDRWSVQGATTLTLDGTQLVEGTDYRVFAYSGSGSITAEVVFAGYGITVPPFDQNVHPQCPLDPGGYDDYAGIDVTDKIVLVMRHAPNDNEAIYDYCPGDPVLCSTPPCVAFFGTKAKNAALHGATAMLMVQDYQHQGDELISGTLGEANYEAAFPAFVVVRDDVEAAITDLPTWATNIDTNVTPDSHATTVDATLAVTTVIEPIQTENVLGLIPGTDPAHADEVVVVGAHIDHLGVNEATSEAFLGADDNASGSAVMFEMARALAHGYFESARTVVFASWNAEEMGLLGSFYFVQHATYPIGNTFMSFSVDMVGAGNGTGIHIYGGGVADHGWLTTTFLGAVAADGLDFGVAAQAASGASDHAAFEAAGVPGVMITTAGTHGYYHTPEDTIDNILIGDLEAAARTMWSGLQVLATATEDTYLDSSAVSALPPIAPSPYQYRWTKTY
ncbi:MAG: M28 family peptidase [Deltaproteobacteria bacterium]|nr:M28 family peptidase [Deltaproteobacteria bacterium]